MGGITIVRHRETRGLFIVVGTGFGLAEAVSPSFFGGTLFPERNTKERTVVVVTDRHGTLGSFPIDELEIVQVGGVTPAEAMAYALSRFQDPKPEVRP